MFLMDGRERALGVAQEDFPAKDVDNVGQKIDRPY
jgi:hypothetical protein